MVRLAKQNQETNKNELTGFYNCCSRGRVSNSEASTLPGLARDLWFRHSRCGMWQLSVNQPSGSLWSCRFYGVNSNELQLNWVTKTWSQTPKYTQVSTSYWWQWEPLTIVWEEEELESGSPGSNNQKLDFRILLAQSENIRRKWEVSESSLYMCARGSLEDGRFWKMEEDSGRFWAVYVF